MTPLYPTNNRLPPFAGIQVPLNRLLNAILKFHPKKPTLLLTYKLHNLSISILIMSAFTNLNR